MKAGLVLTLAFAVVTGSAFAQKIQRTKRVIQEEVPVTIVQSLQKDFSNVSDKGDWKLLYTENTYNSTFTPQFYVFTAKSESGRVDIFYKPDGTVDHAKGVTVVPSVGGSQK